MVVTFDLEGQEFGALNGGPEFHFDEAISFLIDCKDQEEVDYFWDALLEGGGKESQCGWLQDRYGVSWQVIPEALGRRMADPDPERATTFVNALVSRYLEDTDKRLREIKTNTLELLSKQTLPDIRARFDEAEKSLRKKGLATWKRWRIWPSAACSSRR